MTTILQNNNCKKEAELVLKRELKSLAKRKKYPRKAFLINEGYICNQIFLVEKGSLRAWFNNNGKDITFQFFFEDNFVSSFESLKNNQPSLYNLETITPATLLVIDKAVFFQKIENSPNLKNAVNEYIEHRFYHYQKLFISRISNNPVHRYKKLVKENPEILINVPQHYIASYLGITPVSLSRIKNKNINNC